ncbi:PadR family transcriptional regulator [Amycolatopsis sp. PS_44_ISF1]|uniref:PadR family transcriptional regulator n=1 Tax=Amycolatopsis sp. PS_44_ISF1 TaxID=2974917 RepID=UPI0028E02129|nr:PadR family transcriptional regulator [Amycolatopsis sp. PS_44_ISF1]MDT8914900.1 PadR family transcriptional regulator [Amycolatopsis sp. PS_44_ISF1]
MSLRHAVLGLLAEQPGSGYDLLKRFQTVMANVWSATQSQLYGELGKLEKAALIKVTEEGPRGRKEYEITEAGREELRAWLLSPNDPPPPRSESLLRVYFLDSVSPEQARSYVAGMGEIGSRRLAHLERLEESVDWDLASVYDRLALEWGKRFSRMQAEWAEWSVARIAGSTETAGDADAPGDDRG